VLKLIVTRQMAARALQADMAVHLQINWKLSSSFVSWHTDWRLGWHISAL